MSEGKSKMIMRMENSDASDVNKPILEITWVCKLESGLYWHDAVNCRVHSIHIHRSYHPEGLWRQLMAPGENIGCGAREGECIVQYYSPKRVKFTTTTGRETWSWLVVMCVILMSGDLNNTIHRPVAKHDYISFSVDSSFTYKPDLGATVSVAEKRWCNSSIDHTLDADIHARKSHR